VDAKPSTAPITSRFPLPASFTITGRQGSDYNLTPVQEAYLSHHTQTSSGDGFWNVYAALNVPFFSDLKTHLHLGTTEADTTSPIHMMGGWPSHGWEITGNDPFEVTNFDTSHQSFTGVSLAAYRHDGDSSAGMTYLPRAQKEWLAGALAFDYALNWDTTLRYFTAAEPAVNANLLVLQANHQLDYLGPDHADISFGIQYDGLPEMSLSNFVINELGDTSGMREAVKNAVDDAVFTALEDGIDEFADLVSDQAEDLTDQLLDAAIDTPLELFFDDLKAELQNPAATPYADANALISAWFGATGAPGPVPAFVLRSQLQSISTTASASTSLLKNVDAKLAKVETLIDSIIGQVPNATMGVDSGILFEDAFGSRTVIRQLGSELISTLADLTVTPTIDSELGALLNEAAPAFDTITEVLTTLRDRVSEIRTQISGGLELAAEVNAVFAAHAATFQSIVDQVALSTQEMVADLDAQDYAYLDGFEVELKARIRLEIEAELNRE
jgi:hypothetical protein